MSYFTRPDRDGYDPSSVLADRCEPEPLSVEWQTMLDASLAQAKRLRNSGPVELTEAEQQWIDAEAARERAARDREWWS